MTITHEFKLHDITLQARRDDSENYTIVHTSPHQFIDAICGGSATLHIKEQERSSMNAEHVLTLFCMECFCSGVGTGGETSLWKHVESGDTYVVAWTFDDNDYYSTAFSYIERVHPFF